MRPVKPTNYWGLTFFLNVKFHCDSLSMIQQKGKIYHGPNISYAQAVAVDSNPYGQIRSSITMLLKRCPVFQNPSACLLSLTKSSAKLACHLGTSVHLLHVTSSGHHFYYPAAILVWIQYKENFFSYSADLLSYNINLFLFSCLSNSQILLSYNRFYNAARVPHIFFPLFPHSLFPELGW